MMETKKNKKFSTQTETLGGKYILFVGVFTVFALVFVVESDVATNDGKQYTFTHTLPSTRTYIGIVC